jgi:hypothetical protein
MTDYDNMIGTIPPGFLAPADGNYAPNVAQGASPAAVSDALDAADKSALDADTSVVGAQHAAPLLGTIADLGPNNERLEDVKPELVNALRELVRQYRQEGIVARRHEIRRIRQACLFWQALQYAWWNPNGKVVRHRFRRWSRRCQSRPLNVETSGAAPRRAS